jgi:F420-dependent methylenetetrahydromethanopterin dehydrogenase
MKISITNALTNKTIVRDANAEELKQHEELQKIIKEQERLFEAEQTAKAEAKASAMAKLAALGLSDEEVQAIIGA